MLCAVGGIPVVALGTGVVVLIQESINQSNNQYRLLRTSIQLNYLRSQLKQPQPGTVHGLITFHKLIIQKRRKR